MKQYAYWVIPASLWDEEIGWNDDKQADLDWLCGNENHQEHCAKWERMWNEDRHEKIDRPPKNVVKYIVRLLSTKGLIYANLYRDGVRISFPMLKPTRVNGEVQFRWGIEQVQATINHYPETVEYFRRRLTWDSKVQHATSEFREGAKTQAQNSRWTEMKASGWK